MRLILDEKQRTVLVRNLSTCTEYTYCNLSCVDALINSTMMEAGMTGSIHNPEHRDKFRNKIVIGNATISIGDLAVLIDDSEQF